MKRLLVLVVMLMGCDTAPIFPPEAGPFDPPKVVERLEVLDFFTTWCGPCQRQSPTIDRLEQDGYAIKRINVEQDSRLAREYRIRVVPTYVVLINGEETFRTNQVQSLVEFLRGRESGGCWPVISVDTTRMIEFLRSRESGGAIQESQGQVCDVSEATRSGASPAAGEAEIVAPGVTGDSSVETCPVRYGDVHRDH